MRSSERPGPAARTKDTYLSAKFRRIAGPRADGKRKKKAAVDRRPQDPDRRLPHLATPGEVYRDLGGDYFTSRDNPDRRRNRLVAQPQALGFDVELTAAA